MGGIYDHGVEPPGARAGPGGRAEDLGRLLEALANPTRVALLHRLASPAFVPELARSLRISRQAVYKHLTALVDAGLVHARSARRGPLPATQYAVSPSGLFALKDGVRALAIRADADEPGVPATVHDARAGGPRPRAGAGLLLVHGDVPGRWFPLEGGASFVLGREAPSDIRLAYDAYASARHALLSRDASGWTLTDLHSRNGTSVDFRPLPPGVACPLLAGSVLTIGHSQLVLKPGM